MFRDLLMTAAGFMSLFGNATTSGDHHQPPVDRQESERHASSTPSTLANIACVASAVAAREQTLDAGIVTYTTDLNAAYTARAAALASAYAQTGNGAIRKAVRSAWSTFGAALKLAHKARQSMHESVWKQFRAALRACGGGSTTISDVSNASSDSSLEQ